ncbi:MAG: acyltransferase [Aquamicrobium sp.]|uniref:acyltransferase family protein n=1 Tax=Aquamicrobium sp. TaxID=1872579 RepID=UPI00349EBDCC|nr:acyltransferase [Aquamicrobium sp.]
MGGIALCDILERGRNNFDLVRLVAAASVIVSHSFLIAGGPLSAEPLSGVSSFTLGQHAVSVFFILSGLLVAASLERNPEPVAFLGGRVLRVFPGLVACVLVTDMVVGPMVSRLDPLAYFTSPQTWRYLFVTLSLFTGYGTLPGVFEQLPAAGQVNVSLWTLKYEMLCYLLLALLAALGLWRRPRLMWLGFAVLVGMQLFRLTKVSVPEFGVVDQVLRLAICFFIGAGAYRLRHSLRLSVPGVLVAILAFLAAWRTTLEPLASYFALGYLVLCFAALPLGPLRRLCARGDLSYGLYIYGWPVGQTLLLCAPSLGPVELAAASILLAAPLAALSWALVEKPALALKGRLPAWAAGRRRGVPSVLPLTEERNGNYCPRP